MVGVAFLTRNCIFSFYLRKNDPKYNFLKNEIVKKMFKKASGVFIFLITLIEGSAF